MTTEKSKGRPTKYDDPKEAQREANRRYREKNKEKIAYQRKQNGAKNFIKKDSTLEDLDELQILINERREELEKR